jgi:restriction system protein
MSRYWVIAPYSATSPDEFDAIWSHDLEQGIISIGWEAVGSIDEKTLEEVNSLVREVYPDYSESQATRIANMLWQFHNEVMPGDIVVARRGRSVIAAVGEVEANANFISHNPPRAPGVDYDHNRVLKVRWRGEGRELTFPAMVFGMHTIYEIDQGKFESLVEGDAAQTEIEAQAETEDVAEFVLEKYLEDFIVSNFPLIFGEELKLYNDPVEDVACQQFNTGVGIIDILAQEPNTGNFVVIELKKGQASDKVVGQILRYMGWVQENLASDAQQVKGIIICHEPDARLSYAVRMVPGITLKFYQVSFSLRDAP